MLPGGERIGLVHRANGLFVAWGGISFGAGRLRYAQGIARFKEFERQFGVQNYRVELITSGDVAAAIYQFVFGIHGLASADGIRANGVLEDHDVAGTTHGIIRFRGYDHRESLKVRGHVQLAAVVIAHQNFADVDWAAFGRNRPQDIGEVLVAKTRGLVQSRKFDFDCQCPALAFDFGHARRGRHQIGALEIDLSGSTAVFIAHRAGRAAHYIDSIGRRWIAGVCRHLRLGLSLRRCAKRHYGYQGDTRYLEHESPSKNFVTRSIRLCGFQYCAIEHGLEERTTWS